MTQFSDKTGIITGPLIGYRWWNLYPRKNTLCGAWQSWRTARNEGWKPGKNKAECFQPFFYYHSSFPSPSCHCGFWAYWENPIYWETSDDNVQLRIRVTETIPVLGVIEGWGNVLAGTLGFRAEYAKITALLTPPAYKETLATLQPQAMLYTNATAMYAEHPSNPPHGDTNEPACP